jgi:transcriptional regulator with XRE-family HTH domain
MTFPERLRQAILPLGKTEAERAARLGYTVRQIDNWERGEGIVKTLERLERAGVIHINDGACTCQQLTNKTA